MLIFFQELQSISGRHLNLETNHKFSKIQVSYINFERQHRQFIGHNVDIEHNDLNKDVFAANKMSPAAPVAAAGGIGEAESPPPPPASGHVDDFRPTAPGHSPGVGHSIQN
ncbi:conserved hypothetical protein [Ricinus communis]|uniref:Uncharacterized protein n=1 Tax=Ricinus communis TaxID=3988 RepID=B9S8I6_RICCO|nr:conserved hypothetical protein [Ricinus communis]